jgi:hypothetical protein
LAFTKQKTFLPHVHILLAKATKIVAKATKVVAKAKRIVAKGKRINAKSKRINAKGKRCLPKAFILFSLIKKIGGRVGLVVDGGF